MKAMLTSSLGGSFKVNGTRVPSILIQQNGLLDNLKSIWIQNAKVLIICGAPTGYEKNDSVYACLKEAFPMSGLSVSYIDKCDDRNLNAIENLKNIDVIILAGGHVPTQNRFMKQLRLIEDITFDDSVGHEIIALNDGSYIMIDEGQTTLYGEAYMIKDRQQTQICKDGETMAL